MNGAVPCYVTGLMRKGKTDFLGSRHGECVYTPFKSHQWVFLKAHVTSQGARIYRNHHELVNMKNMLPRIARGGVIAKNGEENIVRFKDYTIYSIKFDTIMGN